MDVGLLEIKDLLLGAKLLMTGTVQEISYSELTKLYSVLNTLAALKIVTGEQFETRQNSTRRMRMIAATIPETVRN